MASVLAAGPVPLGEMTQPCGLYVHIPFCDAKCSYCDFVRFTDRHAQIDSYLNALAFEMSLHKGRRLTTLFIGGGTPSVLSPSQIHFLFEQIRENFDVNDLVEATVEANPESADRERLTAFRRAGLNRLSFGLQTTDNGLLSQLQRLHSYETFLACFQEARGLGFDNINVDLIFGLPNQTQDSWMKTLADVTALEPDHISVYALKVEPGTPMGRDHVIVDGDLQADMYLAASTYLNGHGYEHYEISNFAKPGRSSRHNRLYWENAETIGLGISSTGYMGGKRVKNTASLSDYLTACAAGRAPQRDENTLDATQMDRESVMLRLRMREGVPMTTLNAMNVPMATTFLTQGLASVEKGMYSLKPQGWLLSNLLFQQFV